MATLTTAYRLVCWCLLVTLVRNDITLLQGHYPPRYCELTDVLLSMADHQFYYRPSLNVDIDSCVGVADIWPLRAANISAEMLFENGNCSVVFDVGHIFTVYYYYGSNYFHLHYDMLIPLYSTIYQHGPDGKSHAFLPTVETSRLKV
jgi:protein O-GlcNAc transferase